MDQEQNIPMLISFYFGETAVYAQRGASRRLKKWSRAFEMWMDERKRDYQKDAVKQARMAWRRLARQCGKMPWDVTREDIEQHCAWMKREGYAASTINCALGIITSFYEWCDKNRVDTSCEAGFNPAKEARRMKTRRFEVASLWRREEVEALLELLKRDESELGKRERAYFLARINLGVPLKYLQELRWEQIEVNGEEAWVRWREDGDRVKLAEAVWQAMREWLRASGRWEGMRAGKYIFVPLAEPGKEATGGKAEDWMEEQPLSNTAILASLRLYGRKVGVADEKLTMMALRRTAIRFRMEEGESLEGMKNFMDSREENKSTKYRLSKLAETRGDCSDQQGMRHGEVEVPVRRAKPFKEGENITHGFYTRKKDKQAVREILAENLEGMKEEISCLRELMRNLLEQEGEEVRLAEAYSQAAQRLGCLVAANKPVETPKGDSWSEQVLSVLDKHEVSEGRPPFSPEIRRKALGSTEEELAGKVTEEIGTIRLLLRNAYRRAMQGIETREYLRLIDLYGLGCVRLEKLLRISGGTSDDEKLERYLNRMIDDALEDFARKWEAGEWVALSTPSLAESFGDALRPGSQLDGHEL